MYIPTWVTKAGEYLGVHEVEGPGSNPTILKWAQEQAGWIAEYFKDDDTPWCALFVNGVLQECGFTGTKSLAANSFATWGQELTAPAYGAVLVFDRPGGHHVGFYLGETPANYRVRGGNQGNAVSDTWIPKSRLIAVRWPHSVDAPEVAPVLLTDDGSPASTNEG